MIEYFKNTTDFKVEPPPKEPIPLGQVIENIYQNVDRQYYTKVLVKRLRRIEKGMSGEAREKFAAYIPDGDIGKFAERLRELLRTAFTPTMELLRNKDFQNLLINYPRAKRTFLVGYEVEDEVSSNVMISGTGGYQKPEDYLDSFARFVRENPEHIEAIQILLERPREWRTEVLNALRERLTRNHFPEKELRKAHKLVYHKDLVDIISMIKHAAQDDQPIYTVDERIDRAMKAVMEGKSFDGEQTKWLGFIREHLIQNLTLEEKDFNEAPVFGLRGGLVRAQKVFGKELEVLIAKVNYAVAA